MRGHREEVQSSCLQDHLGLVERGWGSPPLLRLLPCQQISQKAGHLGGGLGLAVARLRGVGVPPLRMGIASWSLGALGLGVACLCVGCRRKGRRMRIRHRLATQVCSTNVAQQWARCIAEEHEQAACTPACSHVRMGHAIHPQCLTSALGTA